MGIKRKLYPKGNDLTPGRFSNRSANEIDLRAGFDEIVFGGAGATPHGQKFMIRKMRRDEFGLKIACSCVDELTREPDPAKDCPFCLGEGYYWDEEWVTGYSNHVGADRGVDHRVFYLRYDTEFSYSDKIVEMKLDTEGEPVVPYTRTSIYKPKTITEHRADYGRLEYLAIYCKEDDAIRVCT